MGREPTVRREVPLRFQSRIHPEVYKIRRKIGRHTFEVEDLTNPTDPLPFATPINSERLVKLDMPELDLDPTQTRTLEILNTELDEWIRHKVETYSVDGRVMLREVSNPQVVGWFDLSSLRYRWVR